VFIVTESGLDNIDAQAVPTPGTWSEVISSVDALATDDRCGTVVIDSLDWAEQLCWSHVCETQSDEKGRKVKNIEGYGWGKGYVAALNEWRLLLASLGVARDSGKHVLLIAHAERRPIKNPTGDDYDAWSIKINAKAAGLIREWVDVVGFAELDVATVEQDKRTKGVSTGRRILRTQPAAGYEAKTRYALPAKISLDWPSFAAAVKAGSHTAIPELRTELETRLAKLQRFDVEAGAREFLEQRGETVASLREAIATVQSYLDESAEKKEG
jgi:hypothetical protein